MSHKPGLQNHLCQCGHGQLIHAFGEGRCRLSGNRCDCPGFREVVYVRSPDQDLIHTLRTKRRVKTGAA